MGGGVYLFSWSYPCCCDCVSGFVSCLISWFLIIVPVSYSLFADHLNLASYNDHDFALHFWFVRQYKNIKHFNLHLQPVLLHDKKYTFIYKDTCVWVLLCSTSYYAIDETLIYIYNALLSSNSFSVKLQIVIRFEPSHLIARQAVIGYFLYYWFIPFRFSKWFHLHGGADVFNVNVCCHFNV